MTFGFRIATAIMPMATIIMSEGGIPVVHALRIRKKTECRDKPCCGQESNSIPAPKHRDTTRKSVQDKIQTTLMMSPASTKGFFAFFGLAVLAGLCMGYSLVEPFASMVLNRPPSPMVAVGAGLAGSCTLAYALHGVLPVIWNEMCQGFLVLCGAGGGLASGFLMFGGELFWLRIACDRMCQRQ